MAKFKISKEEVKQMIKEEYAKKRTEVNLKNRLHQINEEISQLMSDGEEVNSAGLDEVEVGGTTKVKSTGWTGEKNGDEKWDPKFQKKGSHLMEDDDEINPELSDDADTSSDIEDDEEMEFDFPDGDEDNIEDIDDLDLDSILAKLADAIDDKIETAVAEKMGNNDATDIEIGEEIPIDDMGGETSIGDMGGEAEETTETGEEEPIQEQNGESVAQDQNPKNATPFDNGKATIPKADQLISESAKKRGQILAGIRRNDFND
jgi:hypothetical protein